MYGIVANVITDSALRVGAKVWLCGFAVDDWETTNVVGVSKGGRIVEKWIGRKRLMHHRAAWVPDHMAKRAYPTFGDKSCADDFAAKLNERSNRFRAGQVSRTERGVKEA